MKSTVAHSIIYKITPETIGLEGMSRSTAMHEGQFYLTLLSFDAERGKDLRKILRWNPQNGQWTTLLNEILTDKYPERRLLHPVAPDGTLLNSADIFVIPDASGGSRIEFEFFSPCGKNRWRLSEKGEAVEAVENSTAEPKFVAFQKLSDAVYAIVEDSSGTRSLVRSSDTGWQPFPSPVPGFLSHLLVFQGQLLVSINDARRGFSLFKLVTGEAEPSWQPILAEGALRFLLNADLLSTAVFNDDLYLTTGVSDPEKIRRHDRYYYSGGFEVLMVHPNADWEIVFGTLRPSHEGLKVPLGVMAEDFTSLLSPQARAFLACDGRLLLCAESELGYHAWESFDGLEWEKVWPDAFATYESVKFAAQHATAAGPVLVMETYDYEKRHFMELWLATAHAIEVEAVTEDSTSKKKKRTT